MVSPGSQAQVDINDSKHIHIMRVRLPSFPFVHRQTAPAGELFEFREERRGVEARFPTVHRRRLPQKTRPGMSIRIPRHALQTPFIAEALISEPANFLHLLPALLLLLLSNALQLTGG
jgi:hypothetical protein